MATSSGGGPLSHVREGLRSGRVGTAAILRIGRLAKERARLAFERQERGGVSWPGRRVPNVPGILRDAETSSSLKDRRFQERPAAIDTGSLRNSIQVAVTGPGAITIGSALPYASTIQRGGPSSIHVTDTMRQNVKKMLKDRRLAGNKRLISIANGTVTDVTTVIPPRPFLVVTDQDRADFRAIAADELRRLLRGGR